MVVDLFMRYTLGLALGLNRRRVQKFGPNAKALYRPAVNIEDVRAFASLMDIDAMIYQRHYIERTSQFIIIVLGEVRIFSLRLWDMLTLFSRPY
jgi:hypothetical protein